MSILACGSRLARMQNFRFLLCPCFALAAILQRRIDALHNFQRCHGDIREISAQPVAAQRNFGRVHIVTLRIMLDRFFVCCRFRLVWLFLLCVERNNIAIRFFCCLRNRRLRRRFLFRRLLKNRLHLRGRRRRSWCRSDRWRIDGLRGWRLR